MNNIGSICSELRYDFRTGFLKCVFIFFKKEFLKGLINLLSRDTQELQEKAHTKGFRKCYLKNF